MGANAQVLTAGAILGLTGSLSSLGLAFALSDGDFTQDALTSASRIGLFADRTPGSEGLGLVAHGTLVAKALATGQFYTPLGITSNGDIKRSGAAGAARGYKIQTSGTDRWLIAANSTAESGNNAGSNLTISAYSDAGALIDTPLSIVRASSGFIYLARTVSITGSLSVSASITLAGSVTSTVNGNSASGFIFTNSNSGSSASSRVSLTTDTGSTVLSHYSSTNAPSLFGATRAGCLALVSTASTQMVIGNSGIDVPIHFGISTTVVASFTGATGRFDVFRPVRFANGLQHKLRVVSTSSVLSTGDSAVRYTGSGGDTVSLAAADAAGAGYGHLVHIKNAGSGDLYIDCDDAGDSILADALVSSVTLAPGEAATFIADGTSTWDIV